jgi:UDP-glucose:(glucosyl)LPS alpha-1,2-glucosyltransferase
MIVTVLPRREGYDRDYFGAVALTVSEFALGSKHEKGMFVLGEGYCPNPLSSHYRQLRYNTSFFQTRTKAYLNEVIEFVDSHQAKIVEVHNRPAYLFYLHGKTNAKLTLHLHNDPLDMKELKTLARRRKLLAIADAVYCVSDYVKNNLTRGIKDEALTAKVYRVYNDFRCPNLGEPAKKEKMIIFAGRITPEKGVDELFAAYKKIMPELCK